MPADPWRSNSAARSRASVGQWREGEHQPVETLFEADPVHQLQPSDMKLSTTVVVITWNRPMFLRETLRCLAIQTTIPDQVLVVDASEGGASARVADEFPTVTLVKFRQGAGRMTRSRNEALLHATGDVIAYIDDDAYPRPDWLAGLLDAFVDVTVAAVAGRTCNGALGEESDGIDAIGRMTSDGSLTGNFGCDPGAVVDIDHGIGANMSFRREVLAHLGGFRDDYPGTALREDTDIFLRLRALGLRAVFTPLAVVDHVAAPHVKGKRFDQRYQFWGYHNHVLLLVRAHGLWSGWRRWAWRALLSSSTSMSLTSPRTWSRPAFCALAIALGWSRSLVLTKKIVRDDALGEAIRARLSVPGVGHEPL